MSTIFSKQDSIVHAYTFKYLAKKNGSGNDVQYLSVYLQYYIANNEVRFPKIYCTVTQTPSNASLCWCIIERNASSIICIFK